METIMGYVRVSTQEQAIHGLSVETQKANLEEWAKRNQCKIEKIYADEGISARKPASKRPALQDLLNEVRAGNVDLIIFTKLDRWFRNVAEYYKVQEVLEKYHVNWRTIHEDYDTITAAGRLKINIMLSVAQDEADRTSERIKVVFENKRHKLEPLTGQVPTGYIIERKKVVKDPKLEPAVSAFFKKYMECGSVSKTSVYILEEFGLAWDYQRADRMLRKPAYYGGAYFDSDGMCPPYISKEDFDKIQAMRKRNARKTIEDRVYLFSGLIVCGECGRRVTSGKMKKWTSPRYYCLSRYTRAERCINSSSLQEAVIESFLLDEVEKEVRNLKFEFERMDQSRPVKSHKSEIAALKVRLGKLKELFLNDCITMEEYKADREKAEQKIRELQEKEQPVKRPDFESVEKMLGEDWKKDYSVVSREKKRQFWNILLKQIRIYKDKHIEFDLNL